MKAIQREVRRALLAKAKADVALTAEIPAARMYPDTAPANPVWPFLKTGAPQTIPRRGTCLDGGDVNIPVHGFFKDRTNVSGQIVETAEDWAGRVGGLIEGALDRSALTIGTGRAVVTMTDMNLLQDSAEAGAYHYFANCRVRVMVS